MQSIQPIRINEAGMPAFSQELASTFENIRNRAYEMFCRRGYADGRDLQDWYDAERELFTVPASELKETDTQYNVELSAPGFEANQLTVTVAPNSITVRGKAESRKEKKDERALFSEVSRKELFRHFDLPAQIDADRVKASLDEGVLRVNLPKATAPKLTKAAA